MHQEEMSMALKPTDTTIDEFIASLGLSTDDSIVAQPTLVPEPGPEPGPEPVPDPEPVPEPASFPVAAAVTANVPSASESYVTKLTGVLL